MMNNHTTFCSVALQGVDGSSSSSSWQQQQQQQLQPFADIFGYLGSYRLQDSTARLDLFARPDPKIRPVSQTHDPGDYMLFSRPLHCGICHWFQHQCRRRRDLDTQRFSIHQGKCSSSSSSSSRCFLLCGLYCKNRAFPVHDSHLRVFLFHLSLCHFWQHRDWIEDESGFVEQTRPFVMTIHADGGNVLGSEAVKRTFAAIDAVRKLPDYDKVCADSIYIDPDDPTGQRHTCEILGMTRFWGHDTEAFRNSAAYSSDEAAIQVLSARTYPDGRPVSETDLYGYPLRDQNDLLVSAQLLVFIIDFPDTDEVESFESDALDVILDGLREDWQAEEGNKFHLEVQAWRSFGDE